MLPPDSSPSSRINVISEHSPLAFIYGFSQTTVTINGQSHKKPWGKSTYPAEPGDYKVSVSYPWLFNAECGKGTIHFTLEAGQTRTITYHAGMIRYLPGRMSII